MSGRHFAVTLIFCLVLAGIAPAASRAKSGAPKTKPVSTAPATLLTDPFRAVIERGVKAGAYRGVAVGLIEGSRRETDYFSENLVGSNRPGDESQFEIGAISEVFTGILTAQAAIEGKVKLRDTLHTLLPDRFPFADPQTGSISLEQLLTQHSTLPTQPMNLFPDNIDDPYADYATEDLLTLLAFYRPDAAASTNAYRYSILNVALAAHLIGRAYLLPIGTLLQNKVFAPLGMTHTLATDTGALMQGHARGIAVGHWHFAGLGGGAGLRSTLPDLLAFLQTNLTPSESPLRAALLLARQPRAAGAPDQVGLGWNVRDVGDGDSSWPLVWRASNTAGFAAFIGFRTDRQKAIVLLGNASEDLASLGIAWLGNQPPPDSPRGYASTTGNAHMTYAGLYEITPGSDLAVIDHEGVLSVQMPGQLPRRLRAVDKDVFATDDGAIGLTFMRRVDEIDGVVLHVAGDHFSGRRLSTQAPRLVRQPIDADGPIALARNLESCGDYALDAATWMRIAASGKHLTLQLTLSERLDIFAYASDRFSDAQGTLDLAFTRNAAGRIDGATLDVGGVQRHATVLRHSVH